MLFFPPGIDFPEMICDFWLCTHFCIWELLSAYSVFCKSSVLIVWMRQGLQLGDRETVILFLGSGYFCPCSAPLAWIPTLSAVSSVQMLLQFAWEDTPCSAVLISFTFTWRLLLLLSVIVFYYRLGLFSEVLILITVCLSEFLKISD